MRKPGAEQQRKRDKVFAREYAASLGSILWHALILFAGLHKAALTWTRRSTGHAVVIDSCLAKAGPKAHLYSGRIRWHGSRAEIAVISTRQGIFEALALQDANSSVLIGQVSTCSPFL
jgi:hypothetical protein